MSLITPCSSLQVGAQVGSLFWHHDDQHPQHLHEYVHSWGCYSFFMQWLVTLGGPELWMPLGNASCCWDFLAGWCFF